MDELERNIKAGILYCGEFYKGFLYAGMHSIDKTGYLLVVDKEKTGYIILERDQTPSGIWATIMQMEENQVTEFFPVKQDDKFQKMSDIVP